MPPKRYNPVLVVLHWVLAVLLLMSLAFGTLSLKEIPNASPQKVEALRGHMAIGVLILVLTLVRLVVRVISTHPAPAPTGMAWADRLATPTHWLLYVLVIVMAGSGIATSVMAGLPDIVFGGSGAPLPESFAHLAPRVVHGIVATLLMAFIGLHIGAALYHQMIVGDGLFGRMGFGKR